MRACEDKHWDEFTKTRTDRKITLFPMSFQTLKLLLRQFLFTPSHFQVSSCELPTMLGRPLTSAAGVGQEQGSNGSNCSAAMLPGCQLGLQSTSLPISPPSPPGSNTANFKNMLHRHTSMTDHCSPFSPSIAFGLLFVVESIIDSRLSYGALISTLLTGSRQRGSEPLA
jgi:hypothetical protein